MRLVFALLLAACSGGGETDAVPADCDTHDPAGAICSTAGECNVTCTCADGSQIDASACSGQCSGFESLCPTYCQADGWSGVACFDPQ